jgi:secretion/DNA translocation related TadE-like protein
MASVLALSLPVVLVASLLASHRQAVRAADLAALAGAQHSLSDDTVACAWARRVASDNGASLTRCDLDGSSLLVEVTVPTGIALAPDASATARAGVR